MYFKDNLKEEYNYLIPDNYQENREEKLDMRTSPTAIGFSLTATICAEELGFIDKEKANDLLDIFEMIAKKYPYENDINAERELIEIATKKSQNQ